jgi:hypothetical protein
LWAAAGGLFLILFAALGGVIQHYFNGEEFFVFHYANNLPHIEAWQRYFYENGRLIETLYWTYLYKAFGYNPLLEHALSFVQLLLLALVASRCFFNAWPEKARSKSLPYLLVFLLLFNWVSISLAFKLSTDNGRISLIFFFLAGLWLQRWAVSQRGRWLALSLVFFLLSVLTYENAALLFPALLLLAWPLLPAAKKPAVRGRAAQFAALAIGSGMLLLIPYWLYGYIARTHLRPVALPAMAGDIGDFPLRALGSGPAVYLHFGQFGNFGVPPLNILMGAALLGILAWATRWIVRIHRETQLNLADRTRWTCIYLASLWFMLFGPLPYVLLGYGIDSRVYSSAIFGVFPLILMGYETAKPRLVRLATIVLIVLFAGFGLLEMMNRSIQLNQGEAAHNIFYRGLKEVVPFVKPRTVFVFLDYPLSNSGCGPSLEMLYDQTDLDCAFFSSSDYEYHAIRHATEIEANRGGFLRNQNWILIAVDENNVPYIVPELNPGDYDLIITWESADSIQTDYTKIVTENLPPASQFYRNLLQRQAQLFPVQ